jgi:HSP20 family protein
MTGDGGRSGRKKTRVFISREKDAGHRYPSGFSWEPPADVIVTAREVVVILEIAGVERDTIDVVTDGNRLKVAGVRKAPCCDGDRRYNQIEIRAGRFFREIDLPVQVDHEKTSARYERGMLEVRVKRADPGSRVRRVEIE